MHIEKAYSPNYDERPVGERPRQLIVHYTSLAGPDEVLACFANPEKKVSSHYYILNCGTIYQLVDDDKRAWHAGKSFWQGQERLNDSSIGIELDNRGHNRGYTDYPAAQMESFAWLAAHLQRQHGIQPEDVLGHSDVSPGRKADPGEKFPWRRMAEVGIGVWPGRPQAELPRTVAAAQGLLSRIGYDCPQTGLLDEPTQHALTAFKRHYAVADLHKDEPLPRLTQRRMAGMPQLAPQLIVTPHRPVAAPAPLLVLQA